MTICELTIICKPSKSKEDGKMLNKQDKLMSKYKEWSSQSPSSFDDSHLTDDHSINSESKYNEVVAI